jgi:hypothetical protein
MFQPSTTDNVTITYSVLHFIKHFKVHESKLVSCNQMFIGHIKRSRQSHKARGMPTTALENHYSYTTFCDTLVGFVLFTGSNMLAKLIVTTYVMWPIRIIVVEAFCCIFGTRWNFRIYDICKGRNYLMSNDTSNDQNLLYTENYRRCGCKTLTLCCKTACAVTHRASKNVRKLQF